MPVFSSKMTLFGKAGLYTIIGMVSLTMSLDSRKNSASVLSITSIKRPKEGCAGYSGHPFEKEARERGNVCSLFLDSRGVR
jgi:hypothetical protein